MRLAEALSLRAALRQDIDALTARAVACARYQEGEEPAESAGELLEQAQSKIDEKCALISRINVTNTRVTLPDGTTLTQALARRDALREHMKVTDSAANAAVREERGFLSRTTRSELKNVTDLDVPGIRERHAAAGRELRELDNAIQRAGWTHELAE